MILPWTTHSSVVVNDVTEYMRYYNLERLHTANGDRTQVAYENEFRKVSSLSWPEH